MSNDTFIDCEPIGDCIGIDSEGKKFYTGVCVNGIEVFRFNCVRVLLEVLVLYLLTHVLTNECLGTGSRCMWRSILIWTSAGDI